MCGITLVPLVEELMEENHTLLFSFYSNDVAFDGSARKSAAQLRLLMDKGSDLGYFLNPDKYTFITNNPDEKEVARRGFELERLHLNHVDGS